MFLETWHMFLIQHSQNKLLIIPLLFGNINQYVSNILTCVQLRNTFPNIHTSNQLLDVITVPPKI